MLGRGLGTLKGFRVVNRRDFIVMGAVLGSTGLVRAGAVAQAPGSEARRSWWWAIRSRPSTASSAAKAGCRCSTSGWPSRRSPATVVNASISGDTTSGGRSRLARPAEAAPADAAWCSNSAATTRCAACRCQSTEDNLTADDQGRAGRRRQGADGRHAGAAELRRRLHARFEAMFPKVAAATKAARGALPAARRGRWARRGESVPGRPHPPDGGRAAAHAGQRLAGAEEAARRYGRRPLEHC